MDHVNFFPDIDRGDRDTYRGSRAFLTFDKISTYLGINTFSKIFCTCPENFTTIPRKNLTKKSVIIEVFRIQFSIDLYSQNFLTPKKVGAERSASKKFWKYRKIENWILNRCMITEFLPRTNMTQYYYNICRREQVKE